jgi:taurine dioxygenase
MMRHRPGSRRAGLTETQKRRKPPVSQPLVRVHPLTGRKVLYANPGYSMWIDGVDRLEGDKVLDYLFRHQERVAHRWAVGDVLMWEHIATLEILISGSLTYH